MTSKQPALVAIVGPTASGKSNLAIYLARQFAGEIINCDSIQMYRRFDLGSGKLSRAEQEGIPHHLIDVLDSHERFATGGYARYAAGEYARLARETISLVEARGKLPIIVGGTGFYLRALLDGLFPGPTRNPKLRQRLQSRSTQKGPAHLHRLLGRFDPASAANIHPHDSPKIIRALEVRLETRRPMSELFRQGRQALEGFEVLKLGLNPPRAALYEAINQRTKGMFEKGLVRNILAAGVPPGAPPFESHGYREVLGYLEGKISLEETIERAQTKTRQYAKSQMTWFRKESAVQWFQGFGTDLAIQMEAGKFVFDRFTARAGKNQD